MIPYRALCIYIFCYSYVTIHSSYTHIHRTTYAHLSVVTDRYITMPKQYEPDVGIQTTIRLDINLKSSYLFNLSYTAFRPSELSHLQLHAALRW